MPYRLFVPPGYDRTKEYPLIVWLHGGGGTGTDNLAQISRDQIPGTHLWIRPDNQARHPAFVLVPQTNDAWSGFLGDIRPFEDRPIAMVPELIAEIEREYRIDRRRRYLAGQSMGGAGAWLLLSARPGIFAATIILCPALVETPASAELGGTAVWLFQGMRDSPRTVQHANEIGALLAGKPGFRYTKYPDADHEIWTRVFLESELVTWLFRQSR
jgi:predicted peptidase